MNEFIDPLHGQIAAAPVVHGCDGCVYDCGDDCSRQSGAPSCSTAFRTDAQEVIFVRAANAPQAPKVVLLTDEQIAQIAAQTWGAADIAPQSAAAFARAIEAAAIKANNLEIPE